MEERQLSVFSVMRRPRWIAMLVLALLVAAAFALLGRWQLERAVTSEGGDQRTETVQALEDVAVPQAPVLAVQVGQLVEASGQYVDGNFSLLADRLAHGRSGYWLVGRFDVTGNDPSSPVAVALGWAETRDLADAALRQASDHYAGVTRVSGRYAGSEGPEAPDSGSAESIIPTTLSVAALVNTWSPLAPDARVYGGYIIAEEAPPGLDPIQAGPPEELVQLNWLNIFYAIEWALFAGFAVFLWYRLVRDAWEREIEETTGTVESEHGSPTQTS